MKIEYVGKDYDPRVTRYDLIMDNLNGKLLKHNGQFTFLDLFFTVEDKDWNVYYGDIVANDKKELKLIIQEKFELFKENVYWLVDAINE